MDVRAAARACFILGLAMAAMALLAATINPGGFHAQIQIIEQVAPAPGAQSCSATEAEAQELAGNALYLLLMGVVQAVLAAAADIALVGSLPIGRFLTAWAHLIGAINAWCLCNVVNGAAVVAIGHCTGGGYLVAFHVLSYVLIALTYASLLGVSLAAVTCF